MNVGIELLPLSNHKSAHPRQCHVSFGFVITVTLSRNGRKRDAISGIGLLDVSKESVSFGLIEEPFKCAVATPAAVARNRAYRWHVGGSARCCTSADLETLP